MSATYSVKVNMNVPLQHVLSASSAELKGASIELAFHNADTTILPSMYANLTNVKSVSIPDGVKLIDSMAFANCTGLEQVNFEGAAPKIAPDAFYNCPKISRKKLVPPRRTTVKTVKDKTK